MDSQAFLKRLKDNPRPIIVDMWAPWCGPCKRVKPILEELALEFSGRVDLWQINADENRELMHGLGVSGIPTLIVYRGGKEALRQVGARPAGELRNLFESMAVGDMPGRLEPSTSARFLRVGAGIAIAALGWANQSSWLPTALGGILIFSAIYDRCPIWRALTSQFKKLIRQA
jgi:thioredoxin 1